jgi:dTDP-4-dehydrorhamnose 3,5-epimerase
MFRETRFEGAFIIEPERHEDERGSFARLFCQREFEARGLNPSVAQCSISLNRRAGTLRGLHHQAPPHTEAKLVTCIRGEIHDVIVDLRDSSPTRLQWFGVTLSEANGCSLYVPEGFAHGFITLTDNSVVHYQISEFHHPESARGVRWDDPTLGIEWPRPPAVISARDQSFELLTP